MTKLESKSLYEHTTQRIKQETDLINNRLSWMLTFQGFLFAAITLVSRKDADQTVSSILKDIIPIIGISVALLALSGVHAAYTAIEEVRKQYEKLRENEEYLPAYGDEKAKKLGKITSYGIPLLIAIIWIIFLVRISV